MFSFLTSVQKSTFCFWGSLSTKSAWSKIQLPLLLHIYFPISFLREIEICAHTPTPSKPPTPTPTKFIYTTLMCTKFVKEMEKMALYVVVLLIICYASPARSDGSDHKYKSGDQVPLYANKVGPFHNPR